MLGGNSRTSGFLEFGGKVLVTGEKATVDGRDNSEEGDFILGAGGVGRREKGGSETVPDGISVEWEHEFNGGTCKEGGENGVYDAVDVMEGEDMEEIVRWSVVPSLG